MVRQHFTADWAFAIRGAIEKNVENKFPQELHSLPLIKTFNFEPYIWRQTYMILVLRDKLSGIPAGPSMPNLFEESDMPKEPPTLQNINEWQIYLQKKFSIRPQDAAIIIPLIDSGKRVEDDWSLWSEADRNLWNRQIELIITRQFYFRKGVNSMDEFYIPLGYQFLIEECARFFKDHPHYEKNLFIMTRFVPGNKLLEKLDSELRKVLRSYGFEPVRADDKMYMRDRNLWNNICIYMICCKYGIAILEDRVADEFNPNVALEYGFMRALNKPTLLLADIGFRNLRADIIGTLRESFDITDIENTVQDPIKRWIKELNITPPLE